MLTASGLTMGKRLSSGKRVTRNQQSLQLATEWTRTSNASNLELDGLEQDNKCKAGGVMARTECLVRNDINSNHNKLKG